MMSDSIIVTFIVQIFGILGFFAKSWADKRANKKEISTRDKNFQLKVLEIQSENTSIKMDISEIKDLLKVHISDNDFQISYKNTLQNRLSNELLKYQSLDSNHQIILTTWTEIITDFGKSWFYSSLRKQQKEMRDNGEKIAAIKKDIQDKLSKEIEIKIEYLDRIIRQNIPMPKDIATNKTYFDQFLSGKRQNLMPLHSRTELLILALAENGLSTTDYIDLFDNYLIEFYRNYKQKLDIWTTIPSNRDIDYLNNLKDRIVE